MEYVQFTILVKLLNSIDNKLTELINLSTDKDDRKESEEDVVRWVDTVEYGIKSMNRHLKDGKD